MVMIYLLFASLKSKLTFLQILSKTFIPLTTCASPQCTKNGISGRLYLQTRGSKFVKFQDLKLQELVWNLSCFFFFIFFYFLSNLVLI